MKDGGGLAQARLVAVDAATLAAILMEISTKLGKQFSNYRMAFYLFSFTSFLAAMLSGNFRQAYHDQVAVKVQEYGQHHQIQFSEMP